MRVSGNVRKGAAKHVFIVLGTLFLCLIAGCGGFLSFYLWMARSESKEIAESHQLWDADRQSEAVAKYKSVLKSHPRADKPEQTRMYQRVIEFETDRGEIEQATEFIQLALKNNVPLSLTNPEAQQLLADVRVGKGSPGSTAARNSEQQKLDLKLKALERKIAALDEALSKTKGDKQEIIAKLKRAGVQSSADLKGNSDGQKYADHLQQVVQEIEGMQKKKKELEDSLEQGKWVQSRLERQIMLKKAGISEEELTEATVMIAKIDEKLKGSSESAVPSPLKLEAVLEQELKGNK